jgi:hypothetical protein
VADDAALQARLQAASQAPADRTAWPQIAAAHAAIYRTLLER